MANNYHNAVPIVFFKSVSSTMDMARLWANKQQLPEHVCKMESTEAICVTDATPNVIVSGVFIAEEQFAGKGRQGNVWHSPAGRGAYVTILLEIKDRNFDVSGLSLVVGVAVLRAVQNCGGVCHLKWPNDIVVLNGHDRNKNNCEYKKLGGVLIESFAVSGQRDENTKSSTKSFISIGIGLNVFKLVNIDPANIDQCANRISLEELSDNQQSVDFVISKILETTLSCLRVFLVEGFSSFRDEWLENSISIGRKVSIKTKECMQTKEEIATESNALTIGISDKGELIVRMCDTGLVKTVNTGIT